jgi:hypothetical protein
MVTFTLHGVSATPMVVVDDKGNSILLECIDNRWTERLARAATIEMGGEHCLLEGDDRSEEARTDIGLPRYQGARSPAIRLIGRPAPGRSD